MNHKKRAIHTARPTLHPLLGSLYDRCRGADKRQGDARRPAHAGPTTATSRGAPAMDSAHADSADIDSAHTEHGVYEVHHTVITMIEGAASQDEAEVIARRMLENGPVDRLSITEGADVFPVDAVLSSSTVEFGGM
jgi:hypothetical protein